MKRQPSEWEKMFANHLSGKRLIYKICNELIQLHSIDKNLIKSGWRILLDIFQRRYTVGQQAHEKYSALLMIRDMQIKITVRYHLIPVKMAIIRKSTNKK